MCILYTNINIYSVSDCTVCNKNKYDISKIAGDRHIYIYTQYKLRNMTCYTPGSLRGNRFAGRGAEKPGSVPSRCSKLKG